MTDATTMGEAIALSSPNGKMSKRARNAALKRLGEALFPGGFPKPQGPQTSERDVLLRQAKELRDLASRGMHPRAYAKQATELEAKAAALESHPATK